MESSPFDIAQDGNLFPREDLLDAVAESDWRDRNVPLAAWFLTALGLAVVAAGLPVARLVVMGPVEFAATAPAPILNPIHALALFSGRTGIGIEAAFFLLSALAMGLCLPALGMALRAAGFGGRLAFVSALVAVGSPLLILHGRLPSDAPFAVLGATLVLAATIAPFDEGPAGERGYALRLIVALASAHLLHVDAAVLMIPTIVAVYTRTTHRRQLHAIALLAVTIAFSAAMHAGWKGVTGGASALFGRWTDVALAGGVAWAVVPFAWKRESEEAPPPRWLAAWLAATVFLALALWHQTALALLALPALAVFVANQLARCARPDRALRWAMGLAAGQIAAMCITSALVPANTTSFAATGPGETRPTDLVCVDDDSTVTAYLLRRRLGLTVWREAPGTITVYMEPANKGETKGRRLSLDRARVDPPYILDSETGKVTPRE